MKGKGYPVITNGTLMFLWAGAAMLAALILVSASMPSDAEAVVQEDAPMSADEIQGEKIFNGEGCGECHSRMVRDIDRGMGIPLTSSDFYPGSSRIGPDLQNLDSAYPDWFLETLLTNPQSLQPGTVMPSYSYLSAEKLSMLITYLKAIPSHVGDWIAIRSLNNIEAVVPDEILNRHNNYFDLETGEFSAPIEYSSEFLITGRGIYNSRCAVCHGLEGEGDGPVSWEGIDPGRGSMSPSPLVSPADFTTREFSWHSELFIYWRISEGVPGTEMPVWGNTLSNDAIWFLVGYLKSFTGVTFYEEREPEEVQIGPQESEFGEIPGVLNDGTLMDLEDWYHNGPETYETENLLNSADSASEEEGDD